jgi:hypothetical protein
VPEPKRTIEQIEADLLRYAAGEPLNEELAALREGRPAPAEVAPAAGEPPPRRGALTDAEWGELRAWWHEPARRLFEQLQEFALQKHVESATKVSQDEPLTHQPEIAQEWARVTMYRRASADMKALVEAGITDFEERQGIA